MVHPNHGNDEAIENYLFRIFITCQKYLLYNIKAEHRTKFNKLSMLLKIRKKRLEGNKLESW